MEVKNKEKKFCPINLITFNEPEKENETDFRKCIGRACEWFNEDTEECVIKETSETTRELADHVAAIIDYIEYGAVYGSAFDDSIPNTTKI